jgi:hypothetical protein
MNGSGGGAGGGGLGGGGLGGGGDGGGLSVAIVYSCAALTVWVPIAIRPAVGVPDMTQ